MPNFLNPGSTFLSPLHNWLPTAGLCAQERGGNFFAGRNEIMKLRILFGKFKLELSFCNMRAKVVLQSVETFFLYLHFAHVHWLKVLCLTKARFLTSWAPTEFFYSNGLLFPDVKQSCTTECLWLVSTEPYAYLGYFERAWCNLPLIHPPFWIYFLPESTIEQSQLLL